MSTDYKRAESEYICWRAVFETNAPPEAAGMGMDSGWREIIYFLCIIIAFSVCTVEYCALQLKIYILMFYSILVQHNKLAAC